MRDGYSSLLPAVKCARVMAGVWLLALAGGVFGVEAQAAPVISSISPESGTNYSRVTITGTGFGSSQGTSTVTFGGTAAARVYEWSDTEIEARPPTSLTVGAHAVVVTVGGVGSNGVDYTRLPQLTAYCLSPSQTIAEPSGTFQMGVYRTGPTTDAVTVTVTFGGTATHGVDYTAPTTLTIAAGDRREEATLEVLDDSLAEGDERINYIVSAEGYIWNNCQLTLEDDNDTGSATSPTISGLNPASGAVGTSVEITGVNFGASRGTSTVSFNGTAVAAYTSWSASSIEVEVPAGATTGEVVVTVGSEASAGVSFTVTASVPTITSLNPDTGAVGTSVEITGTNFGASRGTSTVSFNGTAVAAYTSWSDSSIEVEAPAGATTGDVVVTVGSEVSAGVSFTVTAASPGVSVDPARLPVPEGGMGTYTVVLDTRPTADVTITVAVPQGASITAAPSPLIFTSLNWDSPQTVTVTEPEDDDALDETYSMIHRVTSTDFDYSNPFVQWSVIEVIDNDAATAGVTLDPEELTVPEGGSASYTVVLDTQPTASVRVSILISLQAEFSVAPSPLTFTTTNWNKPRTVTVTEPEDDNALDETHFVTHSVTSSDSDYAGLFVDRMAVRIIDNDAPRGPGVRIEPAHLTVSEGGTGSYTVVLDTQPTAAVTVTVRAPAGLTLTSPADGSLDFTTTDWDTAQTVRFTADHDPDIDDDVLTIAHQLTSADTDYTGAASGVRVRVTDDDETLGPGLAVLPAELTVLEGGTGSYTVVLDTQPAAAVTVGVSPGAGLTVNSGTLTFSTTNWETARTVMVTAGEDSDTVDETVGITHSVTSSDSDYSGAAEGVAVRIADNDVLGMVVSPRFLRIEEGRTGTYEVWLRMAPPSAMTVAVTPGAGLRVDQGTLTFSTTSWSTAQRVTVTADEDADTVDETVGITHSVSLAPDASSPSEYIYLGNRLVAIEPGWSGTGLAMSDQVQVEIIDDDGVTVTPLCPEIVRLNPTAAPVGTEVTITGLNFGANRDSSTVTFDGTAVTTYISWSDTRIVVEVPAGATTGEVVVTVPGKPDCNGMTYTVADTAIWAVPNPCVIDRADDVDCEVTIHWASQGTTAVQVWVSHNGDPQRPFTGTGTTSGSRPATWIQAAPHTYAVNLYDLSGGNPDPATPPPGVPLASVEVRAGSDGMIRSYIWADPQTCTIGQGDDDCTTEIVWTSRNTSAVRVWVSHNGSTTAFTDVDSIWGIKDATFIGDSSSYTFSVHDHSSGTKGARLASVVVTGTRAVTPPDPKGTLTARSSTCTIAAGQTTCQVTLDWTRMHATRIQVRKQGSSTALQDSTQSSGSVTVDVSEDSNTFELYDYSGGRRGPRLATATVTGVTGPRITDLNPDSGDVGTEVTISGSGFGSSRGSSRVTFNGTAVVTYDRWSATSIEVEVPSGATTGPVVVTVNSIGSNTDKIFTVTVTPPDPKGTLTPSTGSCTITSGANDCSFTLNWTRMHATRIQVRKGSTVLEDSTQSSGSVAVDVSLGSNTFDLWDYSGGTEGDKLATAAVRGTPEPAPEITRLNPDSGDVGTSVTITGTNFGSSRRSSRVTFNGTAVATYTRWSDTSIEVEVPTGAMTGPVVVTVNSIGSNTDKIFTVTVTPPDPKGTLTARSSTCTIAAGQTTCQVTLDWTRMHATRIQVRKQGSSTALQDSTQSSGNVTVEVEEGSNTFELYDYSGGTLGDRLAWVTVNGTSGPVITDLDPDSGDVGTEVTITGRNFGSSRGASRATFNGTAVVTYDSWSDTSIEVEVPTGAATGNVVVTVSGKPASNGVNFMVNHDLPTCTISATRPHIQTGGTSRLEWSSTDATSAELDPGGAADPNGFRDVRLNSAGEQKYELTVTGPGGSAICSVTVKAWEAPEAEIDTDDPHIRPGGSSRLEWDSDNASSVTVTDIDTVTSNEAGSGTVRPSATKEYEIRATNPAVPAYTAATDSVTVTVWPAPEAEIDANPKTIDSGDSTRLEWGSDHADSVTVTDIGTVTPNEAGSQWVTPSDTKTYRIRATNPAVPAYTAATDSVTVTVRHEGSISANPNPCTFPSNGNSCGTTLSWSSTGSVEVRDNYGDAIVTNGNPSGTHPVTGITETRVTYSLYKFSNARDLPLLGSVVVYGVPAPPPPPTGSISATPNPCEIASGQSTCTTTIGWSSSNTTAVQVWVTHRQGSTTTTSAFTGSGTTSGSQRATWIQASPAHSYTFSLYDLSNGNSNPSTPPPGSALASVSVTGRPAPPPPPAPVISSLSRTQGNPDIQVTIYGSYFGDIQGSVSFSGSSAEIDSWSDTSIRVLVPAHLYPGTVQVTVTANSLESNEVDFTVTGTPPFRDEEECEDPEDCPEENGAPPAP